MSRLLFRSSVAAISLVALLAAPAAAANKEHQQMMADIRMLQEQQQRLQLQLASLADALKAVANKIDEANGASRKLFADQKLLIDNIAGDLRVVREKADDNNVRLGSLSQDVAAINQSLQQGAAPGAVAPPTGGTPPPGGPQPGGTTPPVAGAQVGILPTQQFQQALSDYTRGQYDLAITGFEQYLAANPKASNAPDAQLYIGDSYRLAGKFDQATAAYTKVINNYPSSGKVPEAYYKRGQSYEAAGDRARARQDYEYLIKTYPPDDRFVILARQRMQGQLGAEGAIDEVP